MDKKLITMGLASILSLSSGCAVLKSIDNKLSLFGEALEKREQYRPENIFRRRGYRVYFGSDEILPVQTSMETNIIRYARFSYAFDQETQHSDQIYLVLSKEFKDILRDSFYEERQRVYPAGFRYEDLASGPCVLSYTFTTDGWEKGKYLYEWWDGMPPEKDAGIIQDISNIFQRNKRTLLLEGFFEHK